MLPVLNLGPLALQVPGLLILIGIWVGLTQSEKHARRLGIDPRKIDNLLLISLIAGVLGARLAFIAQFPTAFSGSVLDILAITPEMLDLPAGFFIGLIAGFIYGQRQKLPLWNTLDSFVPGLAVFMIALGLSHLASGSHFGSPTDLPWAITLWDENRHPTQVYEILIATITAFLVWPRANRSLLPSGSQFLIFSAITSFGMIFIETYRGDSVFLFGSVRQAQIISWGVLAASLFFLHQRLKAEKIAPAESIQNLQEDHETSN